MEHLISRLQGNKKNELTINGPLLENLITICKLQNVLNKRKDSQVKPKEIHVTKSVDNGEISTLDNESMSDEPLSK